MTTRLVALRPSAADLVDAGFVLALVVLGLLGFATTFDSARYLMVGLVGALLGILLAHVFAVLRWHWAVPLAAALVGYLLLGGLFGASDDLLAGFLPTPATVTGLLALVVDGWKDMLTLLPPLAGDGPYVALVYLLGLLAGVAGFSVARRSRTPWTAVVVPGLLLAVVILLGTYEPAALLPQGLGFAGLCFGWTAVRAQRRRRLTGTGSANLTRIVLGGVVLAVALAGGWLLGPAFTPATTQRLVLRSYVEPPVELPSYTSPLVGFPKYSTQKPEKRYYDQELLRVTSSASVPLLRLAVLDDYSGITWNALAGGEGADRPQHPEAADRQPGRRHRHDRRRLRQCPRTRGVAAQHGQGRPDRVRRGGCRRAPHVPALQPRHGPGDGARRVAARRRRHPDRGGTPGGHTGAGTQPRRRPRGGCGRLRLPAIRLRQARG
jgi:hypothetical protein